MKNAPIPIVKPCSADWSQMTGDERQRLCAHCDKHVHNLSEYTPRELETFVEKRDGTECIAYRIRPDGSVHTRSRWAWLDTLRSRAAWLLAFVLPSLFSGCAKNQPVLPGAPMPLNRNANRTDDGQLLLGEPTTKPEPIRMGKPAPPK